MDDDVIDTIGLRLSHLRRLYNHAHLGGSFNVRDREAIGNVPTKENIEHAIRMLENEHSKVMNDAR